MARALASLPLISKAMENGQISYSKVRAVTRVATPNNEEQLLRIALGGTAGQVERLVRAWRKVDRVAEEEQVDYQQKHASLTTYTDEGVIRGRLPAEIGAVFVKALQAASGEVGLRTHRYELGDGNDVEAESRRWRASNVETRVFVIRTN